MRNYNTVLNEVSYGNPVYLTKNGQGDFAIVTMQELDELRAIKGLFGIKTASQETEDYWEE